jgi:hypothetical protein
MTLMELNLIKALSVYAKTMAESHHSDHYEEFVKPAIERCQEILDREIKMKTLNPVKGTYGDSNTKEEYRNGQSGSNDFDVMPKTT